MRAAPAGNGETRPWDARIVDVAVVGLGPVGQALTAKLGQLGHDVVAVERWPSVFPLPRAGHVDHEIMRTLQSLSVAQELADDSWEYKSVRIVDSDGGVLQEIIPEGKGMSGWHVGYSMFQPRLESLLEQAALSYPSVEELRGWRVEHLAQGADYDTIEMRHGAMIDGDWVPGEGVSELRARYVVGCDGVGSVIREQAEISTTDFGFEGDWLVVFVEPEDRSALVEMPDAAQIWDPARPTIAFGVSGKRYCRWEFMLLPGETVEEMSKPEVAWGLIAKWGANPDNARLIRNSVFHIRSIVADNFMSGRAFVAGDAAHLMPQFLGQGLCTGVRDVANLSWKLDLVLRGLAPPALLDTYDTERRPNAEVVVKNSKFMGNLTQVIDAQQAATRDDRVRAGEITLPKPSPPAMSEGIVFRGADGAVLKPAGQLSMQPRLRIGDKSGLLDDLVGAGWIVLATGFDPAAGLGPDERELAEVLDMKLVQVEPAESEDDGEDESRLFVEWLEGLDVDAVVVRPDFYIFAGVRGPEQTAQALADLRSQLDLNLAAAPSAEASSAH